MCYVLINDYLNELNTMDNTIILSHLNELKSFTEFWSIKSIPSGVDMLDLSDYKIFQAKYNVWGYDVAENKAKFLHLKSLTNGEIDFIKNQRLPLLTNPLVKGLYCDIVATLEGRNCHEIVEESIRCYLEVLSHYSDFNEQTVLYVLFGCALSIVRNNKEKSLLSGILHSFFNDDSISTRVKRAALRFLYTSKYYKATECQSVIDSDDSWLSIPDDYKTNKSYVCFLLKIAQASNKPITYRDLLYHRLAENEDIILCQHPLNVCAVEWLKMKADYLEKGHFYEEAIECRKKIALAKTNREGLVSFQMRLEISNEFLTPQQSVIQDSPTIFEVLAKDNRLLPDRPMTNTNAGDDFRKMGIKHSQSDGNGNFHQSPKSFREQLNTYNNAYQIHTTTPIMLSLRKLIETKSFTYRRLVKYLSNSWIGKPRFQVNADLYESNESWLDNLTPSLKVLCRELSKEFTKENYRGDYVCCLDSLTMKLEGCLRDIARAKGLKTIDDNNNEILLDGLLSQMKEGVIHIKTWLLLNSTLRTEGLNLRNKYAHGFSSLADYNCKNAFMLLHCLLRISAIEL